MASRIPHIDTSRCSGCGRCIAACPLHLIAFETRDWRKLSVLQDSALCNGCAKCAVNCPLDVIDMKKPTRTWPERLLLESCT